MATVAELYPELPDDVRALLEEREELAGFALRVPRRERERWWHHLVPQQRRLWWCALVHTGADGYQLKRQVQARFPEASYQGGRCLWLRPVNDDELPR